MRAWLTWIAAGVVGACYSPRPTADCQVLCSAADGDSCPDGFACGASGLCSVGGNACPGDPGGPQVCFGEGIAKPCVPAVPAGQVMLSGTINTDADTRCVVIAQRPGEPQLCVIGGQEIAIGKPVHAVGTRPLVLVATETITVTAMLDARSVRGEPVTGAGAIPCPAPLSVGEAGIGAGGVGGSFGGGGGTGAAGSGVPATAPTQPIPFPDHVRGGCPGGAGAEGTSAVVGKPGGGGGALYLIAKRQIDVQAVIAANGAGALLDLPEIGARAGGGGGGGGSGGLIVLEAPVVTFGGEARVLAMGGGGAGGGGTVASQAGGDSNPAASLPVSMLTAPGGLGGISNGGKGGNGSSMTSLDGADGVEGTSEGGGGGGGGGAGYIKLMCTMCSTGSAVIIPVPVS
ncbi:MAG TPA: hypothetical protein VNO30_12180 [Kofleriaceae bacterium]|nr:hypothetical protein [Kofleriaceae bacterium]